MRRIACTGLVIALSLAMSAVPADASKYGTVKASYDFDLTKPGVTGWFGDDYGVFFGESVTIPTPRGSRAAMLSVMDDSADAVSAAAWQDGQPAKVFCDTVDHLPIKGGKPLHLQVIIDVTPATQNGCASAAVPTTGTITAMFH